MMYNEHKPADGQTACKTPPGRLITFEGIDGTGKTTQIRLLADRLAEHGLAVRVMREPGGTRIGEAVRQILLDKQHTGMCAETELLLFAAARAQLVREVILPALASGTWVICDRFHDSTAAYQGYGRRIDRLVIQSINRLAVGACQPDRTILLDMPVEKAMERLSGRQDKLDRMDHESVAFMQRTRDGYRQLAEAEPNRFIILDAEQPVEQLAEHVYREIREGFGI